MATHTSSSAPAARLPHFVRLSPAEVVRKHGLLIVLVLVLVVFYVLRPATFLAAANIDDVLTSQSVTALLALAVMIPLATNEFDLSVGYHAGLAACLMIGLQSLHHVAWPLCVIVVLLLGALVGTVNGLVLTRFGVSSFIATLGSGMVLFGFTNWFTGGEEIVPTNLPTAFTDIASSIGDVPVAAIIVVVVSALLYMFLEHMPAGRRLFAAGASRRAAELTGINVRGALNGAFMMSGLLAAMAGIVLAANLQAGDPSSGPDFLLPAFAGAMLGATSVKPGRVNVVGTLLAVLVLAFLFSGVQQLGAQFYVEYFFDGGVLIVAVAASVFAAKKARGRRAQIEKP